MFQLAIYNYKAQNQVTPPYVAKLTLFIPELIYTLISSLQFIITITIWTDHFFDL